MRRGVVVIADNEKYGGSVNVVAEEKPKADKIAGGRMMMMMYDNHEQQIDRGKLALPSLISVSAETADAPPPPPPPPTTTLDFTRGFGLVGEARETVKVEETARIPQSFAAAPAVSTLPLLPTQPGFIRLGTELSPTYPGLNDLWGPHPIGAPYQYPYFPCSSMCVSSTGGPSLKRKVEVFGNSHNAPHMESLFGCMPGSFYQDSVLHPSFVPVPAVFQNPFFATPMRAPMNYCLSPTFVRNQEINIPSSSWGPLISDSLVGSESGPFHKRKVIRPNVLSGVGITVVSDGNSNANLESLAKGGLCSSSEQNALEENQTTRPSPTSVGLETQSGSHPSASVFNFEHDKEIDGKGWIVLVQKELRNTDVGNLGRIVLPKKDAEANLPRLVAKDGIILNMEDMTLSTEWKFKYRYWPNNKSRMYVMENTGDFIRAHKLQTGDFFIIYKEQNSGKYIARGKKGLKPLDTGDMVRPRGNGGIDEGENNTKCVFGTEPTAAEPVDCQDNSKAGQGTSASRQSFTS